MRKVAIVACLLLCLPAFAGSKPIAAIHGTQSITGSLNISGYNLPNVDALTSQTFNKIVEADQFPGADMCAKIVNALAALPASGGWVGATHFSGTQACSSNPFATLPKFSSTYRLHIEFGAVTVQTTVPWSFETSMVSIVGKGPQFSRVDYTGGTAIPAILTVGQFAKLDNAHSVFGVQIKGMSFYSNGAHVTDGILWESAHHGLLRDVNVWGITGCGVHTKWAVTDTFDRVRVSQLDAVFWDLGYRSGPRPAYGLCLDGARGHATTDGTVIDSSAEGLSGVGWWLSHASNMVFTSGTSEGNAGTSVGGIEIDAGCGANTFIGTDLEANNRSGIDVLDNGSSTALRNILAISSLHAVTLGRTSQNAIIDGGDIHGLRLLGGAVPLFSIFLTEPAWFTTKLKATAGVNLSGTASPLTLNGSAGTSGQCAISNGSGVTPTWGSCAGGTGSDQYNTFNGCSFANHGPNDTCVNRVTLGMAMSDTSYIVMCTEYQDLSVRTPILGTITYAITDTRHYTVTETTQGSSTEWTAHPAYGKSYVCHAHHN